MPVPPPLRSAPRPTALPVVLPPAPVGAFLQGPSIQELPVHALSPWQAQPRHRFEEASLKELAESIKANGVLNPLIVRPTENGWEIIAGERRWRAAQLAGLEVIPAQIRAMEDGEALILSLVENLQREDLNVMDRARALRRLYLQLGSWDAVGKAIGIGPEKADGLSQRRIFQLNALNELPEPIQEALARGEINEKHARALGRLHDEQEQESLFEAIQAHRLSSNETEGLLRELQRSELPEGDPIPQAVERIRARKPRLVRKLSERIQDNAVELCRLLEQDMDTTRTSPELINSLRRLDGLMQQWALKKGTRVHLPMIDL